MSKFDEFYELAGDLIKQDEDRDRMFVRQDQIFRCEWKLPEGTPTWVRAVKGTDGHDALRAVSRILSSQLPNVTVWPWGDEQEIKDQADKLERGLRWFLFLAMSSGVHAFLPDLVMSAARYDEVCAQVLYTPYQKRIVEGFLQKNDDPKDIRVKKARLRLEALNKEGPFHVSVRQPRFVHSLRSEYGLEGVVYASLMSPSDVVANYGLNASEVSKLIKINKAPENYAVLDCLDYTEKVVMAIPVDKGQTFPKIEGDKIPKGTIEILKDENKLGFLNWVINVGGTALESDEEFSHIPMLYTQDHADQYDLQNMLASLVVSEAIAHAAAPRGKKSGPGSENISVEYGEPQQDISLKPGQDYDPLQPPQLDKGLLDLEDRVRSDLEKSTVPRVLQGGNVPVQTFSTLNLAVQSGMVTIDPYKRLSERSLEGVLHLFMRYIEKDKKTLQAWDKTSDEEGKRKYNSFSIGPDDIAPAGCRIDVELQPKVPVDHVARANGVKLMRDLGLSKRVALERAGETDAMGIMDESRFEAMEDYFLTRFFKKIDMKDQLEMQAATIQMQTEAQMAAQEQAQASQQEAMMAQAQAQQGFQQPGAPEQPGMQGPQPGTPPGAEEGIEGQGFNPAMGGTPASQANPELIREMQTGRSASGEELA